MADEADNSFIRGRSVMWSRASSLSRAQVKTSRAFLERLKEAKARDDAQQQQPMDDAPALPLQRAKPAAERRGTALTSFNDIIQMKTAEEQQRAKLNEKPKRWPFYVIRPESRLVVFRDVMTTLALFGVFLVVPFELGFVESPTPPDPTAPLFIFVRMT